jgi:hypothetical protein
MAFAVVLPMLARLVIGLADDWLVDRLNWKVVLALGHCSLQWMDLHYLVSSWVDNFDRHASVLSGRKG